MSIASRSRFALTVAAAVVAPIVVLIIAPPFVSAASVGLLAAWMALTRAGRQTWSIARTGIATIPQRLGSSAVVVVSTASVVGVLVALLAMGAGMEATLKQSGTLDTAIVLQMGSGSEVGSLLPPETVAVVSDAPQILQNAQKHPIASAELVVTAALPAKNARRNVNVAMRGVEERIWELRPDVEIIAGRKFKPGLGELLVGYGSYEKLASSDIGSKLTLNGQSFTIVGIFDSKDACNSELWGDRTVLASAFHRGSNATSSIRVRLTDARDFDAFKVALAGDPRINVDAQTTREFYNRQSEPFTRLIHVVCVTVGIIMAFGAVFGALNAMYATITARSREIAILRAIGFRSVPVIGSVLLEMMLLAGAGGVAGAAIAWITFDGFIASTTGESGQIVFAFNASPALLWDGLTWALTIGLLGGLLPAVRAAYMPITAGLRDA